MTALGTSVDRAALETRHLVVMLISLLGDLCLATGLFGAEREAIVARWRSALERDRRV